MLNGAGIAAGHCDMSHCHTNTQTMMNNIDGFKKGAVKQGNLNGKPIVNNN